MCKSEQGVTVVELLIAMAIVSTVLAGTYRSFISSSKRLIGQNGVVEMQAEARAAMDFMVQELRLAVGTPTISTTVTANDTISFDRVEDAGGSSAINTDRKSTRLNSSHIQKSRMPSSA